MYCLPHFSSTQFKQGTSVTFKVAHANQFQTLIECTQQCNIHHFPFLGKLRVRRMCGGYFVISQILHIILLLLLKADLEILSLRLPNPLIHNLLLTPSIIKAQTSPSCPNYSPWDFTTQVGARYICIKTEKLLQTHRKANDTSYSGYSEQLPLWLNKIDLGCPVHSEQAGCVPLSSQHLHCQ